VKPLPIYFTYSAEPQDRFDHLSLACSQRFSVRKPA